MAGTNNLYGTCNDVYGEPNREKFQSINNSCALKSFLKDMAKEHRYLYHYTTSTALETILKTRKWKFSSARKTNDLHECYFKGCVDEWKYIYSCSFSHGDEDNIGMWKMYGEKKQSICMKINISSILNWIQYLEQEKEFYYRTRLLSEHDSLYRCEIDSLSMHDIAYIHGWQDDGCSKVCWGNIVNPTNWTKNISAEHELTGFIKNSAWEYEKETRIMVSLRKPEWGDKKQEKPTEIFVSTNDDLLYGIEEITFSPFSTETRNELINNVKKLRALLCKNSETKFLENYFNKKINSNNSI